MFVLTIDQQDSTRTGDAVPWLLGHLADVAARLGEPVLGFERTVGDEVQGVLGSAEEVVTIVLDLIRTGGWSVGVGAGEVDLPLPASTREASGPAFVAARQAVEEAKGRPVPVAVRGDLPERAAEAEALLRLVGTTLQRRSAKGWEVVDLLADVGGRQKDVAERLGISESAVSQRLRAAAWTEERDVLPLLTRLLEEAACPPG